MKLLDHIAARIVGDISLSDNLYDDPAYTVPTPRQPVAPVRYTGGEGGWCPGHEPADGWERKILAVQFGKMGGHQDGNGHLYMPNGLRFMDWDELADHLIRHPGL